jgi:hypothetical protein
VITAKVGQMRPQTAFILQPVGQVISGSRLKMFALPNPQSALAISAVRAMDSRSGAFWPATFARRHDSGDIHTGCRNVNQITPPVQVAVSKLSIAWPSTKMSAFFHPLVPIRPTAMRKMKQQAQSRGYLMEQTMRNPKPAQKGETQTQQQGQSLPSPQQSAGTAPAPKPRIGDWASI